MRVCSSIHWSVCWSICNAFVSNAQKEVILASEVEGTSRRGRRREEGGGRQGRGDEGGARGDKSGERRI